MNEINLNIKSEIGKLKAVLLHKPSREIENLVPEYLSRLLFDDIPFLKIAKEEHDAFSKTLFENGVDVYYIENLLLDVLKEKDKKISLVKEFLSECPQFNLNLKNIIEEYFLGLNQETLVDIMISGIRKTDLSNEMQILLNNDFLEYEFNDKYDFLIDPLPNLYFTRDIGAVIGSGLSISKMKKEARKRETLFLKFIYENHIYFKNKNIPLWYDRDKEYSLEGGDELVLNCTTIAIGCSERTSRKAIEIEAQNILNYGGFEKVLVFDIPKCRAFMHLDTVFTMIDYNKFTIHPGIEKPMDIYSITKANHGEINIRHDIGDIEHILKKELKLDDILLLRCGGGDPIVAAREQWNDGSNTLAIAPGVVITYERNYVSNELFQKNDIKVITIPSSELSRGRGGPRCMSMPLEREDL